MNPPCAKCSKTVYPVEKLNVLDKNWHKGCFKCDTCSITLTLKSYKGFNKTPYCQTHYPSQKHTAVADTPENLRLQQQTKNISLISYHKDYNTSVKGTKMSVVDDPDSVRARKTQDQVSQIKYHGKDPCNPASTPLARPYFSSPGEVEAAEAAVEVPIPAPEPEVPAAPEEPAAPVEPEPPVEPVVPEEPVPVEPADEDKQLTKEEDGTDELPPAPLPAEEEDVAAPPAPVEDEAPGEEVPGEEAPAAPEEDAQPNGEVKYVAMYDYDAADDDEVTIKEGDVVANGQVIAEGWMVGTNTRTGLTGMMPSNYVELLSSLP